MNQFLLPVTKQARIISLGTPESGHLVIALHGYGQLATYFARKFEQLSACHVVIPEGLHRFYLEGSSGRVGASWMTKEARETDIADNIAYLNDLLQHLSSRHAYEKITVLGFSQGGATAARWVGQLDRHIDHLILWACVFPEDMQERFTQQLPASKCTFVLGNDDPYFPEKDRELACSFYERLNFSLLLYPGKHQLDENILSQLIHT